MPMVKRRATGRRPRTRETVLTAVAIALLTLAFTVLAAPSASADLHEHPSVPPTASAPVMLAGTGLHIAGPVITAPVAALNLEPWHGQFASAPAAATVGRAVRAIASLSVSTDSKPGGRREAASFVSIRSRPAGRQRWQRGQ